MTPAPPIAKRIVLIGGGHSHVSVLRSFGMVPEPAVGLTVIARELDAPYSGMLPGFVAGHYTHQDVHIDLVRLAHFAGARVIHGEVVGIDRANRQVLIAGRPPLAYDLLSINTGITPDLTDIEGAAEHAIPVKPVSTFAPRWQELEARALRSDGPRRFAIIGAGAAGFELILAIRHRLLGRAGAAAIDSKAYRFTLIGSETLLPSHNARARALARTALAEAEVELIEGEAAERVAPGSITLASGKLVAADAVLVATKAAPPAWFANTDLPRDRSGFLAVRPSLQVGDDDDIFAVGDCASVLAHPREKSGVFAVRQGPPLTENLRRRVRDEAARPFRPQRRFLTLLSTGDRSAIAARASLAGAGTWAWTWKDRIDRAFMTRFNELPVMRDPEAEGAMRCGGCAAKVGPATLAAVLERLPPSRNGAIRDLAPREDAAVLEQGPGPLRLETVDFFRAFWPEPYLFGEIAAVHAMSDIYAMGGTPEHALATAVLPHASPRQQEDDLFQLMAGARAAFDCEGVTLVGGHSSEGSELAAGFFVSGTVERDQLKRKNGLKPGDRLILTRPLGTALLFAALMRGTARAPAIEEALSQMRRSNRDAARVLSAHGASAMTDVTGFGVAGHLIEMLEASGVGAQIDLAALPLYSGVRELARAGVASSLLAENLALKVRVSGVAAEDRAAWAILFDPQTSGGLLAGVGEDRAEGCLAELRPVARGACLIGRVIPQCGDGRATGILEVANAGQV